MRIITSKENKIKVVQETLLYWYENFGRKFYWREPGLEPYELIIAEILLQRTKAETVSKFYQEFLERFPSWKSIHEVSLSDLEEALKPIGLYKQRALRVKKLAQQLSVHDYRLPKDESVLEEFSMIGQYILNAILLLIHKKNTPLLDVNMSRVLERLFGSRKLADIRYDPYLQYLAKEVVNHPRAKELNWAILDFAALVCKARNPLCSTCPLNINCQYFLQSKHV